MRLSGRKHPSFTRPWTQRQRVVLLTLLLLNLVAFVAQLFLDAYDPAFVREYLALSQAGIENAYAWQFLTTAFLHLSAWHFAGNMIVLYLLGRDVESIIGQRDFLLLYFFGALLGELGHLFLMPATSVLLGGSGGVAAVLVAYATILPELELASFRSLRLKAKHLAYVAGGVGLLLLVVDRGAIVMHSVYLGGGAAGWIWAHLLGFGRPSALQRALQQRKVSAERYEQMEAGKFIEQEVDPLLEKISREGIESLTRTERRILDKAREKLAGQG
ncbi:MAG: rhomboid family intramembrane serine protease [Chthoniobacterales bacterium]